MKYFIAWPNTATVYSEGFQPDGAVEVPAGLDPAISALVGGALVVDPIKAAAKQAAEDAKAAQAAAIIARRARLRTDVANANTLPALKALVADIVAELGI